MKTFSCVCGQRVFFENTLCLQCGRTLGYDPSAASIIAVTPAANDRWHSAHADVFRATYRLCRNWRDYEVCNWLVADGDKLDYCIACRLNRVVPSLSEEKNRALWASMEASKRRLIYTLLSLRLPVVPKAENPRTGLAFAFLEDRRSNPLVDPEHVLTGHSDGLITVNLIEADHAQREATRQQLNEPYRTLLGHFRHESGHYYWQRLIRNSPLRAPFRALFGDETVDYDQALSRYYASGPERVWEAQYISAYSEAHPLEDWAETWAHYLHMVDTVETAAAFGLVSSDLSTASYAQLLDDWIGLTISMNSLNRSMGLNDAYPFVLSTPIIEKLHFVHRVVSSSRRPTRYAATA